MIDLSPAAQAVLDAAYKRMDDNPHNEVEATLAAALRAAADQLAYEDAEGRKFIYVPELLTIATELETQ